MMLVYKYEMLLRDQKNREKQEHRIEQHGAGCQSWQEHFQWDGEDGCPNDVCQIGDIEK